MGQDDRAESGKVNGAEVDDAQAVGAGVNGAEPADGGVVDGQVEEDTAAEVTVAADGGEGVPAVEPAAVDEPAAPVLAVSSDRVIPSGEPEPSERRAPAAPSKAAQAADEADRADEAAAAGPAAAAVAAVAPVAIKKSEPGEKAEEAPAEPAQTPAQAPVPAAVADTAPAPAVQANGRRRLRAALWPPRLSRGQLVVALLLFSLGLALAIQVRSTNDHSQLRGARQEDLVRILDELDSRQQRLQQEKAQLEQSLAQLENSSNQAKEAQEQTRKKVTELGILAGTVKATGPGIVLTVDDPQGQVKADMLLDTLQELRAAGAEAIQINDVRVVVDTYFTDVTGGGVQIDGKKVSQPYRFTVVGNPQDLTPALNIPGGVVRTLESHQARATIVQQQKVVVDALTELRPPLYAKPAAK